MEHRAHLGTHEDPLSKFPGYESRVPLHPELRGDPVPHSFTLDPQTNSLQRFQVGAPNLRVFWGL